jgi:hypothetical protein
MHSLICYISIDDNIEHSENIYTMKVNMRSTYVLINKMTRSMIKSIMNCALMLFILSATCCNITNRIIRNSQLMTYIGHIMLSEEKATIAMKTSLVLNPLYTYVVHVSVPFVQRTTMVAHQPCQLIFIYDIGG